MHGKCARCGRKVKSEDNWLKAHLWTSTAIFHWSCLIALMKAYGEAGPEQATREGGGTNRGRSQRSETARTSQPTE